MLELKLALKWIGVKFKSKFNVGLPIKKEIMKDRRKLKILICNLVTYISPPIKRFSDF